jgi:hypothetical protein
VVKFFQFFASSSCSCLSPQVQLRQNMANNDYQGLVGLPEAINGQIAAINNLAEQLKLMTQAARQSDGECNKENVRSAP